VTELGDSSEKSVYCTFLSVFVYPCNAQLAAQRSVVSTSESLSCSPGVYRETIMKCLFYRVFLSSREHEVWHAAARHWEGPYLP
jgi:hypothetical protein